MRRSPTGLLHRLFTLDTSDLRRLPRAGFRLLRMLALVPREFLKDHGAEWAASLAYYTLLSLVPLGILAFSLANVFENLFNLQEKIMDFLREQGLPDTADKAGDVIGNLIDGARAAGGKMGVIGTLGLVLTAMGLFSALDRAFNRIWKTGVRRTFLQRFRAFWFVLTLGPFLAGISVWATASLKAWARDPGEMPGLFGGVAVFCIPFVLTWCLFFVLYMYLPNTRVRPVSALVAAVIAGTVWEIAKRGFNLYVANAGSIDAIYGPLGILPLFMLWTYVTWTVVLMGTELAYVEQNYRAILAGIVEGEAERGAPREFHAIRLLLAIYRPFRRGEKPPDLPELCAAVEVRTEAARDLLEALQAGDFVRRDRGGLYLPAREASRTRLSEVVSAVRGGVPAGEEALSSLFGEAESLRSSFLAKTTLEDLLTSSRSG